LAKTILAIDIGSTKVSAVIAEINEQGVISITGHGFAKSMGVKKGIITNIELASKCVKKALSDARRIAGNNISVATVSISNAYAKNVNSTGIVNIPNKDISIREIKRVMETALYNANISSDDEVIHVLPYNFRVDDQDFIEDPYGMNASRMEVDVNIITVQKSSLSNLKKAIRSAGLDIEAIVLNSYASAIATMGEDEKELGVAVIDMGGQTSNLVIHIGNSVRFNDYLGVGSNHITNDLSMALHTPLQVAEQVKIQYGSLTEFSNETIELPVIGDHDNKNEISLEIVHRVILARVEEALMLLSKSLDRSGLRDQIGAGIILTGGMTKLEGMRELAQDIFHGMPVRIAKPWKIGGLFKNLDDPVYSTIIGLLFYQAGGHTQYEINNSNNMLHHKDDALENTLSDIALNSSDSDTKDNPYSTESGIYPPQTVQDNKDNKSTKSGVSNNSDFNFMDLPNPTEEKSGVVSKFINWARQLF